VAEENVEEKEAFAEFLLKEYDNIAAAHFNADKTITQFFQFYLLIISIPVTAAGIALRFSSGSVDISRATQGTFAAVAGAFSGIIAIVGLCMMAHIVNLRIDGLRYARTVNGIRRYFYNHAGLSLFEELATRILPRTTAQPRYWELR
jgi:hypothetical protein